jgi:hypothetical protein
MSMVAVSAKRRFAWCSVAFGLAAAGLAVGAEPPAARVPDKSFVIANPDLHWYANAQGMQVANAVGDPATTAHSNYIRMVGGTASDLHVHSFDYYGVVITGVVVNERTAGTPERRLMAGSLWYQKANESHVTKCVSSTECIFFVTSSGPFDYLPVAAH